MITSARGKDRVVKYIEETLVDELIETYPTLIGKDVTLKDALTIINAKTGNKFVFIIDEWDVLIREADEKIADEYIDFLRGLFKSTEAQDYIALAYLTEILPIKKVQTQSALNNFKEYTVLNPSIFAPYFGFTKDEVKSLCEKFDRDYEEIKRWYDGYLLNGEHIYNPQSVVFSIQDNKAQSYWSNTSSFEAITPYINMNYEGLRKALINLLAGREEKVDVLMFQNDMRNVSSLDDVLTLLIHLGYLGYNSTTKACFVPNEEIRGELIRAVKRSDKKDIISFINSSEEILTKSILGDEEFVASKLEEMHEKYSSAITYNSESSLTSAILLTYLSSMNYYLKPIRELPAGKGFSDIVYIPKRENVGDYPTLLIELKWDKTTKTAIDQIREKNYPESLIGFSDNLLLVVATYDKKTKKHSVKTERLEKY